MSWLMDDVLGFDPNGGGIYGVARDVLGDTIADDWLGLDPNGGGLVGTINTIAPFALAAMGAYAYDPSLFAGLSEGGTMAGAGAGEAGAALGTEGTTAAMQGGFGQGAIAPEVTAFAPDAISTATNIPAATAGAAEAFPYSAGPNMMGPQTAADLGTGFQTAMTNAGVESSPTLGGMFKSGWDAINKPLWEAGPSARQGFSGVQLAGGLYDMYAKNQMANAQRQHLNQINGMYAPGSPEYNLMMQQIARKDAAAGRNSQYGVRAQNLAGIIADKKAQMLNSAGYSNTLNSQLANRYGGLNSMFALAGKQATPKVVNTTGG